MSTPQPPRKRLPVKPSEEHLRKQAKRQAKLEGIQLAEAQHRMATDYGCRNWAELLHTVETMNRGSGEQIQRACAAGDVPMVAKMLDQSPELLTPQLWPAAIFQGQSLEITRLLLDRGLDPNLCSAPRKPLHLAGDRGLVEVVRLLLSRGARLDVVDGENITPYELMNMPLVSGPNVETIRQLLRDAGATDSIFTLLNRGEEQAALQMLREQPSLRDAVGPIFFTPLHTAARTGAIQLVRELLSMGAPFDGSNRAGNTPLWLACQSDAPTDKRLEIAKLLLDAGANPRRDCEERSTPLHYAAWRGPSAMVELLLRHNAKEWQTDKDGKRPLDYARRGVAEDKGAIVKLLDRPVIRDPHFRAAVNAIHTGNLPALRQLLADHPNLARDRAIEPECYTQSYFKDPKLLWFVANNPTLMETMPANIVEIAAAIIDAGADADDLNITLGLVMTSSAAVQQQRRDPLMHLLLAHGATGDEPGLMATLGHWQTEPILLLIKNGQEITAPLAAGLGMLPELSRQLQTSSAEAIHAALSMAVINRQLEAARLCLQAGADVNQRLLVHVHSYPIHQAAINDDVPMLQLLVEFGAKLDVRDTLWQATPFQWAVHENKQAAKSYFESLDSA